MQPKYSSLLSPLLSLSNVISKALFFSHCIQMNKGWLQPITFLKSFATSSRDFLSENIADRVQQNPRYWCRVHSRSPQYKPQPLQHWALYNLLHRPPMDVHVIHTLSYCNVKVAVPAEFLPHLSCKAGEATADEKLHSFQAAGLLRRARNRILQFTHEPK